MDSSPVESAAATLLIMAADRNVIADAHSGPTSASTGAATSSSRQQSELRKANKPLMEKRRRARINKSLNELKSILVESMERNSPGHSKWEKADILEMTVQYLHCLRNQKKASRSDPLAVGQFIAGYSECIRQIQKFSLIRNASSPRLGKLAFPSDVQDKLTAHLLSYLKTFSDDATRALQTHSATTTPRCPSPPTGFTGGSSDASGSGFGEGSPPSRQSTLSSFASPSPRSPGDDSVDSDDGEVSFSMLPPNVEGSRRDLNNNASRRLLSEGRGYEKELGNHGSSAAVWRPW